MYTQSEELDNKLANDVLTMFVLSSLFVIVLMSIFLVYLLTNLWPL